MQHPAKTPAILLYENNNSLTREIMITQKIKYKRRTMGAKLAEKQGYTNLRCKNVYTHALQITRM